MCVHSDLFFDSVNESKLQQQQVIAVKTNDYIRHHVTEADTLVGIALRYGVTTGMFHFHSTQW